MAAPVEAYIALSAVLFAMGMAGVLIRRSPLAMLMSIELMWGAAALAFLTFSRQFANLDGHVTAFMVVVVAAAEAAIGLALIVMMFRERNVLDADDLRDLRG